MKNAIQYNSTVIQFSSAPLRDGDDTPEMVQVSALNSAGGMYVYNKALHYRIGRTITYPRVSDAVLSSLRSLYATLDGGLQTFVWYDHLAPDYFSQDYTSEDYIGGGHLCRFTAPIRHTQIAPGQHRVELEMEEFIPLAMPTAASWDAASAALAGSFPCWLFRLTVAGTDYWMSDHAFTVAGWNSQNVTAAALVKSWGSIRAGITGGLDEYKCSDFSIDLLIDPAASPNLRTLATTYELEQYPVELYLWFHGLDPVAHPPRMKWRGYVRNHPEMDDTTLRLECEDESSRLSKNIGTLLDVRSYPNADPKDVGKMIPIVYGTVPLLPALAADVGKRTTLPASISAASTSFDLSDVSGLTGATIQVDDEQMQISGVSGSTVTVNRGINGTLAATHSRGAAVWEVRTEYLYIAAEKLNGLAKVSGTIDDLPLDITSLCTIYTGQPGSEHPSGKYPGLAVISLPGVLSATQLDALGVVDQIAVADTIAVSDTVAVADTIDVATGSHLHSVNGQSVVQSITNAGAVISNGQTFGGNFPAAPGSVTSSAWTCAILIGSGGAGGTCNGVAIPAVGVGNTANMSGSGSGIFVVSNNPQALTIINGTRTLYYSTVADAGPATGVAKTGNAVKSGAATKTGNAAKTGTVVLLGASTVRSIISHTILCDCVSNTYLPSAVAQDLLTSGGGGTLTTVGSFPSWYRIDGALTEYKSAREWLDTLAFQVRAWFVLEVSTPKLIVRPDVLSSVKTLSQCLLDGNKRSLKIKKAALSEVINVLTVLYARDWSQSRSAEGYGGCISDRMVESIGYYGERAPGAPELFWFDLIRDYATALHVMGYYLGKHSRRPRIYTFSTGLDNEALKFADGITLGFENNLQVEIAAADQSPGDKSNLDRIEITATDIHREWPYMAADYYSEDFSLSNS